MDTCITFFSVDNGDMCLVVFGDRAQTTLLIDCNIAEGAKALEQLRDRLKIDERGRPFVDAFLLSHPDQDHCRGLATHFYLGPAEDYPDDSKPHDQKRILIREMWSSPLIFRRASKEHVLCEDAKAWNTEARRRVQENRRSGFATAAGNRILILGEDEDGKTDDLQPVVIKTGNTFNKINNAVSSCFSAKLLAPQPKSEPKEEELLSKNHSSVVLQLSLASSAGAAISCRLLTGGDAEVAIWEKLWKAYGADNSSLKYDVLLSPHHCSWHSLSYDSWSALRTKAKLAPDAVSALSQIQPKGIIVASSKAIVDDDNDPPCFGAKRHYAGVAEKVDGKFYCTGDSPGKPLEFKITTRGPVAFDRAAATAAAVASLPSPIKPWGH